MFILKDKKPVETLVYPSASTTLTATSSDTAFTLGSFVEVVPSGSLTKDYSVSLLSLIAEMIGSIYEVHIFKGEVGSTTLIAKVYPAGVDNQHIPVTTEILPAGTRLSVAIMTNGASLDTIKFKVHVITYI